MIRVMIADDQRELTDGIRAVLECDPEIRVVGVAPGGKELLGLLKDASCDLILMDVRMPGMNGVLATREVKRLYPEIKIVILTTFDDSEYILDAMNYGASGYLLKDTGGETLIASVKNAMKGEFILPARVAQKIASAATKVKRNRELTLKETFGFSDRETEIALMILEGFNNRQIASALILTEGTCRNYISSVYEKVGADSRQEAAEKMKQAIGEE